MMNTIKYRDDLGCRSALSTTGQVRSDKILSRYSVDRYFHGMKPRWPPETLMHTSSCTERVACPPVCTQSSLSL